MNTEEFFFIVFLVRIYNFATSLKSVKSKDFKALYNGTKQKIKQIKTSSVFVLI